MDGESETRKAGPRGCSRQMEEAAIGRHDVPMFRLRQALMLQNFPCQNLPFAPYGEGNSRQVSSLDVSQYQRLHGLAGEVPNSNITQA